MSPSKRRGRVGPAAPNSGIEPPGACRPPLVGEAPHQGVALEGSRCGHRWSSGRGRATTSPSASSWTPTATAASRSPIGSCAITKPPRTPCNRRSCSAWRDLPKLRDVERYDVWLHRLLVNACYEESRRQRRWTSRIRVLPIDGPAGPDPTVSVDDRDLLDRAFTRLTPATPRGVRSASLRRAAGRHDRPGRRRAGGHGQVTTPPRDPLDASVGRDRFHPRLCGDPVGMSAQRDPDVVLAAWLDDGPADLPSSTRRAISTAVRTTPQARTGLHGLPAWRPTHVPIPGSRRRRRGRRGRRRRVRQSQARPTGTVGRPGAPERGPSSQPVAHIDPGVAVAEPDPPPRHDAVQPAPRPRYGYTAAHARPAGRDARPRVHWSWSRDITTGQTRRPDTDHRQAARSSAAIRSS